MNPQSILGLRKQFSDLKNSRSNIVLTLSAYGVIRAVSYLLSLVSLVIGIYILIDHYTGKGKSFLYESFYHKGLTPTDPETSRLFFKLDPYLGISLLLLGSLFCFMGLLANGGLRKSYYIDDLEEFAGACLDAAE